ncbi:hypothetical protein BDZ91DRAFT_759988 [Kalaharituber pfeilii]|nr:hypothetical protein BDZ91DRAFT_759988 [Kalaharituber pfeilii]
MTGIPFTHAVVDNPLQLRTQSAGWPRRELQPPEENEGRGSEHRERLARRELGWFPGSGSGCVNSRGLEQDATGLAGGFAGEAREGREGGGSGTRRWDGDNRGVVNWGVHTMMLVVMIAAVPCTPRLTTPSSSSSSSSSSGSNIFAPSTASASAASGACYPGSLVHRPFHRSRAHKAAQRATAQGGRRQLLGRARLPRRIRPPVARAGGAAVRTQSAVSVARARRGRRRGERGEGGGCGLSLIQRPRGGIEERVLSAAVRCRKFNTQWPQPAETAAAGEPSSQSSTLSHMSRVRLPAAIACTARDVPSDGNCQTSQWYQGSTHQTPERHVSMWASGRGGPSVRTAAFCLTQQVPDLQTPIRLGCPDSGAAPERCRRHVRLERSEGEGRLQLQAGWAAIAPAGNLNSTHMARTVGLYSNAAPPARYLQWHVAGRPAGRAGIGLPVAQAGQHSTTHSTPGLAVMLLLLLLRHASRRWSSLQHSFYWPAGCNCSSETQRFMADVRISLSRTAVSKQHHSPYALHGETKWARLMKQERSGAGQRAVARPWRR